MRPLPAPCRPLPTIPDCGIIMGDAAGWYRPPFPQPGSLSLAMVRRRRLLLLLALTLVVSTIGAGVRPDGRVSPRLARALANGDPALRAPDGRLKVWVRFRDKGVPREDLPAALAQAGARLDPRALARRERRMAPGAAVVDGSDLDVSAAYLAHCAATGAQVQRQSRWLNAASFLADASQVRRLARLPEVAGVDLVARFLSTGVPTPVPDSPLPLSPENLPRTATSLNYGGNTAAMLQANVPAAHELLGLSGAGVVVGMLDTGFRTQHAALAHIPVLGVWDFVNNDPVVDNQPGDPTSSRSHGTETLSTVAAWAPGSMVAPAWNVSVALAKTENVAVEVRVEEDNWVAGLEWAEALGADIISSSLGYIDWYTYSNLDGNTCVTTKAADLAAGRGLLVVNSAGNDRATSGHLIAPADADSIVTVGAVDAGGVVTYFSSPGPTFDGRTKPDVAAHGLYNTAADPNNDAGYVTVSGTSFSCPLVTGVAALVLERVPDLTPMQVIEALRLTAGHPSAPDNDTGWGIVNAYAAATWFGPVFTHAPLFGAVGYAGPYNLSATITARLGLGGAPQVHHRVNGGPWQVAPMAPAGPLDQFTFSLPNVVGGGVVDYWLDAVDGGGHRATWPQGGASAPITFTVWPGTSPVGDTVARGGAWLAGAAPNPFNPRTTVSFGLAAPGRARLALFDVRGRLVRTLLDADLGAGDHAVIWDGRDDQGRDAPSGTYLCRLTAAGLERRSRMQLVR